MTSDQDMRDRIEEVAMLLFHRNAELTSDPDRTWQEADSAEKQPFKLLAQEADEYYVAWVRTMVESDEGIQEPVERYIVVKLSSLEDIVKAANASGRKIVNVVRPPSGGCEALLELEKDEPDLATIVNFMMGERPDDILGTPDSAD